MLDAITTLTGRLADIHPQLPMIAGLGILICVALLLHWIFKSVLLRVIHRIARSTVVSWDDELVSHNVIGRLVQVVPALVILVGLEFVPGLGGMFAELIRDLAFSYIILALTLAISAVLSAANAIYETLPVANQRPLKGFVQLIKIGLWLLAGILIVATLINREPWLLLSGFGAMTAIILLVFKDTILSLVASIQLTAQDIVRIGDWIEMPQFGADGDVIDMQLHTVKIQNFDKTITTIPTYRLIDHSFKNWRGMQEAGVRRIKRALHIDVSSVRFLSDKEIDKFRRFALLRDYIADKNKALAEYNSGVEDDAEAAINLRRLTNIGTFRAYVCNYLKHHPSIKAEKTLIVRQLPPGAEGLPLEIYCFAATTVWDDYEGIQADIFDHLLAVVTEFDLRLFQQPAGSDFQGFSQSHSMVTDTAGPG